MKTAHSLWLKQCRREEKNPASTLLEQARSVLAECRRRAAQLRLRSGRKGCDLRSAYATPHPAGDEVHPGDTPQTPLASNDQDRRGPPSTPLWTRTDGQCRGPLHPGFLRTKEPRRGPPPPRLWIAKCTLGTPQTPLESNGQGHRTQEPKDATPLPR